MQLLTLTLLLFIQGLFLHWRINRVSADILKVQFRGAALLFRLVKEVGLRVRVFVNADVVPQFLRPVALVTRQIGWRVHCCVT